ncbi:MAG: UbiA family prenyltransferase [Pseudomonadota bacterium]
MTNQSIAATVRHPFEQGVPLVIDVDGTLLQADLSAEHLLRCVAETPLRLPAAAMAALKGGRSGLKSWLVEHVPFDPTTPPVNPAVMTLVEEARAAGRPVVLASASDRRLIEALDAEHGPFDAVLGSDETTNLSGHRKAAALEALYGRNGFDYVGDSAVDGPVWASARRAVAVSNDTRLQKRLAESGKLHSVIKRPDRRRAFLRALRPHQWLKNLLVFVPIVAGHHLDAASIAMTIAAFVAFCLIASAGYVANDLLDLPSDRSHPIKSTRPFAAGLLSIHDGLILLAVLSAAATVTALAISPAFFGILGLYMALTLAYSLFLKRLMMVDVMVLGLLYTMRILAGGIVVGVAVTDWLLAFSQLFFLSLAIVKRLIELVDLHQQTTTATSQIAGRGYVASDIAPMGQLAAASAFGSSTVLALYINSGQVRVLYSHPEFLWGLWLILIFWLGRLLVLAHRRAIHDDPVVFAATDRVTLGLGVVGLLILLVASLW